MKFILRLTEKSWQTPGADRFADPAEYRPAAAVVGLYAYFGVAIVIFSLLAAAYLMRMGIPGAVEQHGGGGDWRPMPKPPLLWINTLVLLASSLVWEEARRSAYRGSPKRMRRMAVAGGVLGLVFLAGQLLLWRQYQRAGYYLAGNPANAFFYLLTSVHGLHLAGGLVAGARALGQMDTVRVARNIRLCAIYWHFLLLVWLLLAGLLLST